MVQPNEVQEKTSSITVGDKIGINKEIGVKFLKIILYA